MIQAFHIRNAVRAASISMDRLAKLKHVQVSARIYRLHVDKHGYAHTGGYYGVGDKLWSVAVDGVGGLHGFVVRAGSLKAAKREANDYCSSRKQYDASTGYYVIEVLRFSSKPSTFAEVQS